MATPISFIVSRSGTINAVVNGKAYTVPAGHRNYERAKAALRTQDGEQFVAAVDFTQVFTAIPTPAARRVEIRDGRVFYLGKPLHNVVTERILALAEGGWPYDPVANFLDNVEQNPSYRAVQELYTFLEHRALPLTDTGCFLAYKAVQSDWLDKHSKTFVNRVGSVVSVPRNTVNDDFREGCSNGLHVGSIEYVQGFKDSGDHVVICRVNPKDVVSVPIDAGCTKLRCCEYQVIGEYTGDLTGLVYTAHGDAVPPPSRNDPAQGVTLQPPPRADWGNPIQAPPPVGHWAPNGTDIHNDAGEFIGSWQAGHGFYYPNGEWKYPYETGIDPATADGDKTVAVLTRDGDILDTLTGAVLGTAEFEYDPPDDEDDDEDEDDDDDDDEDEDDSDLEDDDNGFGSDLYDDDDNSDLEKDANLKDDTTVPEAEAVADDEPVDTAIPFWLPNL